MAFRAKKGMYQQVVLSSVAVCSAVSVLWSVLHGVVFGGDKWALYGIPLIYLAGTLPAVGLTFVQEWADDAAHLLAGIHVVLVTCVPLLLTVEMGGFTSSGGLAFWSAVGPPSSVLFFSTARANIAIYALFFVCLAFTLAWTNTRNGGVVTGELDVPGWYVRLSMAVTLCGVCLYTGLLLLILRSEVRRRSRSHKAVLCSIMPAPVAQELFTQQLKNSSDSNEHAPWELPGFSCCMGVRVVDESARALTSRFLVGESSNSVTAIVSQRGVRPRHHRNVTVVFVDVAGFSTMCAEKAAPVVLEFLDQLFLLMDAEAKQFGISKVRTVGDGYLAVSGLMAEFGIESDLRHSSLRAVLFGLSVLHRVKDMKMPDGELIQLRIGLATGSLFSGVVGSLQPQFDIFGHLANFAARMEQSCAPSSIHMSTETFDAAMESINKRFPGLKHVTVVTNRGVALKGMPNEIDTVLIRYADNTQLARIVADIKGELSDVEAGINALNVAAQEASWTANPPHNRIKARRPSFLPLYEGNWAL